MNETQADCDSALRASLDQWDQFLETTRPEIGYKQTSWWAEFQRSRGLESFSIVAREGEAICGGATILIKAFAPGKFFYYIPHGPVLPKDESDAAELFESIVAEVNDRRIARSQVVSHLRLEPRWLCRPQFVDGFRESTSWHEPRNTLCVDLSLSEDALLSQMKSKGRYNIRVARRHGVSVVEDNSPQGLDDFIRLYSETIERQKIRRHSIDYFRNLAATLFPFGRGSIFFAEYQGERLATAWVVFFGDTATYKYGGSLRSNRNVMAPYLLHFEIMLRAKFLGCRWYDFYGVSPADAPDEDWANFSVFKRKFGGQERGYVPALDLVYDPNAYQAFEDRKKS